MSSDYPMLESDIDHTRFKRFVKHLGLAAGKLKQKETINKRKKFVETIGEFTESPDIKAFPDVNEELRSLERKVSRTLELEQALEKKEQELEDKEKVLESKESYFEQESRRENDDTLALRRRINFLEKKLNENESLRLQESRDNTFKIAKLSEALHNARLKDIKSFEAHATAFVDMKAEESTKKKELMKKLVLLEKKHSVLKKSKKHDPETIALLEDKISRLKALLS